jgi:peptide chain release factor 1
VDRSLPEILARYRELTRMLEDPEVARDPGKVREIAKERGRLERPARLYDRWLGARRGIRETEALLADPEMKEAAEEELLRLRAELEKLTEEVADEVGSDDADQATSVIVEVRPGTGGDEAALFAGELFDMYCRFAESRRWKVEVLEAQKTDLGGVREAVFALTGEGVYRMLKFESGGHRVQRVPATETQGRIHTSTATVAVLPEYDEVEVEIRPEDLRIDTMRAGGPGGQKVNKTESAVRITHLPTGLVVKCQDEKSQHKNKARAMRILKSRIHEHIRQQRDKERAVARKSQIGSGDRSERIRTYNFPQDRLTDHRLDDNLHGLPSILAGGLGPVVEALRKREKAERLKSLDLGALDGGETR